MTRQPPDNAGPYRGLSTRLALWPWLVVALMPARPAHAAPEYIESERPTPGSVDETQESIEHALKPTIARRFETLRETFREGDLKLHLRNYYFDRERDSGQDNVTWAQGGALNYGTPWWKNRVRLATTFYVSEKLYGPHDKGGSLLLKNGQNGFTVLGEAYVEIQPLEKVSLKLYRQLFDIPYINRQDSRMVPNTFEGVTLIDSSRPRLSYGFAQIQRMKKRDASQFVSMTEAGGVEGRHRGVSATGFRYELSKGTSLGAFNMYGWDFMNIFYAEANTRFHLNDAWGMMLSAQYTDQRAVGDELGGDFDTRTYGVKSEASYAGMIATLAYTSTANNAGIQSPWGGRPSYLSLMISDFDRAGESAWLIGLSSDFSAFGENGFSGFINFARGDAPDGSTGANPDQQELDITLDYRFKDGPAEGLWIRLRSAVLNRDDNSDIRDLRAIVNYEIPLF